MLCVRVEDKGKGIGNQELKKIINRFGFEGGNARSNMLHGLDANEGNGLFICKNLV